MTAMENITQVSTKHNYKGFIESGVLCFSACCYIQLLVKHTNVTLWH